MASTEEVISTLLADDYIHSSIQFLIDENMRTVTVPPEGVVLGVTGDKDVNRINFKMVRYYDGLDLSTFQIRINYVNANGDANYYQVTDTTIEDDSILFTWLVSSDAAAYKGTVSFAARLYTVEDTIVKESFNSTIATAEVLEGIIVDEYMPPDAQQDLIALLLSQIEFPESVGKVDTTEGASAHGEIFNDYTHNAATGGFSHAEGNSTTASGANSHAEGSDTTASSNCAHAEGFSTTASKYYSHAEGSNTTASGTSSHAEGSGTTASGYYSHAEGSTTNATADTAHAEGYNTTASGYASHAEGSSTTATAGSSHAEGSGTKASSANQHVQGKFNVEDTAGTYAMIIGNGTADDARSNALTVDWNGNVECGTINGVNITQISSGVGQIDATEGATDHGEIFNEYTRNKATGKYSHAEGYHTTASDQSAHAEGYGTTASGYRSHAEGNYTKATGDFTHAEGDYTTASGANSHAEGDHTEATGTSAHSEGANTTASGFYSHAEGWHTTASGKGSHTEGLYTKASSDYQHVHGQYNVEDTAGTYAMIIGNGTSDDARSNALTVDWNGNVECRTINGIDVTQLSSGGSGVGQVDTTKGATYHGEIFNSYPDPDSHYVNSATGQYSHAEGFGTTASGDTSHAEGASAKASGNNSHAEGASTEASGQYSHAEGNGTTASGERSHAEGSSTTASSNCAHAEGSSTTASGDTSHAEGSGTTASGYYSHAEGYETTASGDKSHTEGYYTKASSENQHVQGKFNVEDTAGTYAMIIGNGYATFNNETHRTDIIRSNAFTVDWNGNIQCGKTDSSGNFTTHGTINGIDIVALAARVAALEGSSS